MTLPRPWNHRRRLPRSLQISLLAVLAVSGCAQMGRHKSRGDQPAPVSTAVIPAAPVAEPVRDLSLAEIIDDQLQRGHYAEGEQSLHHYLAQHPGDRPAKAMLRQLTANPERWLGRQSQAHVVQPGESYSSLAGRYLGDPGLFLILARYNHSTNPFLLRVGETVRLPSAASTSVSTAAGSADADGAAHDAAAAATAGSAPTIAPDTAPANESSPARAQRLQRESVALLDQGHKQQALDRLDEALSVDPQLKPGGSEALSLRKDLVTSFHQRAIVLYRDQRLDQAIALWDRVLAIDPKFEPAIVYRTRALELKHRLKQL
jgi:tetratricopeptide (TPR) repeat protein